MELFSSIVLPVPVRSLVKASMLHVSVVYIYMSHIIYGNFLGFHFHCDMHLVWKVMHAKFYIYFNL